MKKVAMNYWLDIIAFVEFVFLTTTGILMQYSLPERSGHRTIWGLTRHEWGDYHFYIAMALFTTLAIHIVLHWNWIVNLTRGHADAASGRRLMLGILALIALILLASTPVVSPVDGVVNTPGHVFGRGQ